MPQSNIFILPNFSVFSSFQEAAENRNKYGIYGRLLSKQDFQFSDLRKINRLFVVAEPGYGKSTLLSEIGTQLNFSTFHYLDLKKSVLPLEDNFENFKDEAETLICLDALDEVGADNFSKVFDSIKKFCADFKKISIVISCRWHYFEKKANLFEPLLFNYLHLYPFDRRQIIEYLLANGIENENVEEIVGDLRFRDRSLIIQIPRYLSLFLQYIKEKGFENAKSLDRDKLFEYFVNKALKTEDEKQHTQTAALKKEFLCKLALVMEIYQTNIIKKSELTAFLDEIKSDLKLILLNQTGIDGLYDQSLLKTTEDSIEFDNAEFQEYMAALELSKFKNPTQTTFSLAVDPVLKEIHSSWLNTLTFLSDIDTNFFKSMLDFAKTKALTKFIDSDFYKYFLTRPNAIRISSEEASKIFKDVYEYYQTSGRALGWEVSRNLAYYFQRDNEILLKNSFKNGQSVQLSNVIMIIHFLFESKTKLLSRSYWKNRLIQFCEKETQDEYIKKTLIQSLKFFDDPKILNRIYKLWGSNKYVCEGILELFEELNPNSQKSIDLFAKGCVQVDSIKARQCLYKIKSKIGVSNLIRKFLTDKSFYEKFLEDEPIHEQTDSEILKNITNVYDKNIHILLFKLIDYSLEFYQSNDSKFVKQLLIFVSSKDDEFVFRLIKNISKKSNTQRLNFYRFEAHVRSLLKLDQAERFIKLSRKLFKNDFTIASIFYAYKFESVENSEKLFDIGKKYFPNEYKAIEERDARFPKDSLKKKQDQVYQNFLHKLAPEPGKYSPDVFQYFLENKKDIDTLLTPKDQNRLVSLMKGSILDKFDPAKQTLTLTKDGYRTHTFIRFFGDCLKVAALLKIDLNKYRKKIISFIPFSYSDHIDAIMKLVKHLSSSEVTFLRSIYKKRDSDLWRFMPSSLLTVIQKNTISGFNNVIRDFVESKDVPIYDRAESVIVLADIGEGKRVFSKYFKLYKNSLIEERKIAIRCASILVSKLRYTRMLWAGNLGISWH